MISQSNLINYASCFLESEIEQIEKILEKDTTSENDRYILSRLLREYKNDLAELEVEIWNTQN